MSTAFASRRNIANLVLVVIVVAVVISRMRQVQHRLALEHIRESAEARQAFVRYVQIRHACSEEVAYQRIAAFVKKHMPGNEQSAIDNLLANDRQRHLELAQNILVHHPDEIDEI